MSAPLQARNTLQTLAIRIPNLERASLILNLMYRLDMAEVVCPDDPPGVPLSLAILREKKARREVLPLRQAIRAAERLRASGNAYVSA